MATMSHDPIAVPPGRGHVAGQVERVQRRERARHEARAARIAAARKAAQALRGRYGEGLAVYLFGSVLDPARFRLDSDVDLAVQGLPTDRLYEAWAAAEAAAGGARLDLVRLEDTPDWLAAQVRSSGERLA